MPKQPVASNEGSPDGPAGAETEKLYWHEEAPVQALVAPVTCQSQGVDSDGMAAAEAVAVKRARMAVLDNMMDVGDCWCEELYRCIQWRMLVMFSHIDSLAALYTSRTSGEAFRHCHHESNKS